MLGLHQDDAAAWAAQQMCIRDSCAIMGVFAPLTGIIGAMQAAEALKLISGASKPIVGRLLLLDGLTMEWRSVKFARNPECAVCGTN